MIKKTKQNKTKRKKNGRKKNGTEMKNKFQRKNHNQHRYKNIYMDIICLLTGSLLLAI